jgi:hypothetical protein
VTLHGHGWPLMDSRRISRAEPFGTALVKPTSEPEVGLPDRECNALFPESLRKAGSLGRGAFRRFGTCYSIANIRARRFGIPGARFACPEAVSVYSDLDHSPNG